MADEVVGVRRLTVRLEPDTRRTIARFFWPGEQRAKKIIQRIKALPEARISELLDGILQKFQPLNPNLDETVADHAEQAFRLTGLPYENEFETRMLIGAYFSMEYAFESAALFNPSMVPAYDQSEVPSGSLRYLMSLRAIGEGHISSITFRRGLIDAGGNLTVNPAPLSARTFKKRENRKFRKSDFLADMEHMGVTDGLVDAVMSELPDSFSFLMLEQKIEYFEHKWHDGTAFGRISRLMLWAAEAEYEIELDPSVGMEQMVLFPISKSESQGMEDMRLVRFEDDDGTVKYFGTYTAYNGTQILPQVLEAGDPRCATVQIMRGRFARNKGMAIFPKRIEGQYAMIGRIDGENLFLLKSDSIDYWDNCVQIVEPQYDWEYVQIGNCGSPIRTEAGWLLLTHGVGPMRNYCIGAVLLDGDDPSRMIGRLKGPLLSPNDEERSGYVPNVVYSCGGLVHNGNLVIPYGISDAATGFAVVSLDELLGRLC